MGKHRGPAEEPPNSRRVSHFWAPCPLGCSRKNNRTRTADGTREMEGSSTLSVFQCFNISQYPPRPLATWRVEAVNQQQTLQSSQNLQTSSRGRVYPPLPPPNRSGSDSCSHCWNARRFFEPSKTMVKPMKNQHFRFLAPPSPSIYASYLPDRVSVSLSWSSSVEYPWPFRPFKNR